MACQIEPLPDLFPVRFAALTDEPRQRQELAGIGLGFRGADRPSRFRADGDEVVVSAGHRTAGGSAPPDGPPGP